MSRQEMLEVVKDLYEVLNAKKVSPNEAAVIAYIFKESVEGDNEIGVQRYRQTAIFHGNPPEK